MDNNYKESISKVIEAIEKDKIDTLLCRNNFME